MRKAIKEARNDSFPAGCGLANLRCMQNQPLIVTINGSPSASSRTRRLLEHVTAKLAAAAVRTAAIQVRELPAAALLHAQAGDAQIARAHELLAQAGAVIIGTPIYKAAYSGLLKAFLDLLPQDALAGKVVLPVATGGSAAHTLALDYALRPVLAALGARQVLASVYAVEQQVRWSEDAGLDLDPEIRARLRTGVEQLIDAVPAPVFAMPSAPPTLRLLQAAAPQRC